MSDSEPAPRVRIWDLPTRVFHWLLVLFIPFQYFTAEEDRLDLHILGGTFILGLLLFRLLWGLFGSSTARFANFVKGPRGVIDHIRGKSTMAVGHTPLGALSVLALIGVLLIEVALGLFAGDEDGIESGPLSHLIDPDLSERMAELHEDAFDVLLILIGMHVAAIVFYTLSRRKNLVGPMIMGRGRAPLDAREVESATPQRFLLAFFVAAVIAWWVQAGVPL